MSTAASCDAQTFSFYPAIPAPLQFPVRRSAPHACSYFPERQCEIGHFLADRVSPPAYQRLMDSGFRRSGKLIYQPVCSGCRRCVPIRVPVKQFTPSKSQRRCWRRNQDLQVTTGKPALSDEKLTLYRAYLRAWHDRGKAAGWSEPAPEELREFLYDSPVETVEFEYRSSDGRLLAVGICDVCELQSLSSVYFYFDPADAHRGLGTFGALVEIEAARNRDMDYYYLGYWVDECRQMQYKSVYRPHELLGGDGVWRAGGGVVDFKDPIVRSAIAQDSQSGPARI